MPGGSSIQQFIDDLKEGQSNITRKFNLLFGVNPGLYNSAPAGSDEALAVAWLRDPAASSHTLDYYASKVLLLVGVLPKDLDHINKWPDREIDKATKQMAKAIDHDQPCHFSWELYEGNKEVTKVIKPVRANQAGEVVFRSPRKNVNLSATASGDVTVDVNP